MKLKGRIPSSLKISYWNAQGLINKKTELTDYMEENSIDIMLVNETHLTETKIPKIRNYTLYKTDRDGAQGGGTAIYIKNNLYYYPLHGKQLASIEETGIAVKMNKEYSHTFHILSPRMGPKSK